MPRAIAGTPITLMSLTTQKQLRQAFDPEFCYICGQPWEAGDDTDRDHVPPKRLFAKGDRTPPLTLRTHVTCNNGQSGYDEQIGQLVSLLWKESPTSKDVSSLKVSSHAPEGMMPFCAVEGLNLRIIVARWVKGFHAALYREPLPQMNGFIHEPFPGGDELGEDTSLHFSHTVIVNEIKKNRAAGRLDKIDAYDGQLRYECLWTHLDDGHPICMWALDVYAWHRLGDVNNFPARSCVGWYEAPTGVPEGASRAVSVEIPFRNFEPLNAFE